MFSPKSRDFSSTLGLFSAFSCHYAKINRLFSPSSPHCPPCRRIGIYRAVVPHPSLPCVKGGAPQGWCSAQRIKNHYDCRWQSYLFYRRDCRGKRFVFALPSGKFVTFYRTIPQSASLTAPFAQGGLWRVRRFEQLAKLKFEPLSMSFRATLSEVEGESRNLRISSAYSVKLLRRSLDSAPLHSG